MAKLRLPNLKQFKEQGNKFSCSTAYDASTAALLNEAEIDLILVGDSLGMVVQGHSNTIPVTVDDIIYHCHAVSRANSRALLMADLPFLSYASMDVAIDNVRRIMQAGAEIVKIEGGKELYPLIETLSQQGVAICGHLGLQPQFLHKRGGFKSMPNTEESLTFLTNEANALIQAGIDILLLECVPSLITKQLAERLEIPIIGIGSGPHSDGQILVFHDLIGMTKKPPPFSKNYLTKDHPSIIQAIQAFNKEVKEKIFPC